MVERIWGMPIPPEKGQPSPDLQARCVALVERLSTYSSREHHVTEMLIAADEARAIMSEMRPADPDILLARDIVFADHVEMGNTNLDRTELDSGKLDNERPMRLTLTALRRGRELERGK